MLEGRLRRLGFKGEHMKSYQEVIQYLAKAKREKHLLIGNGFSISYNPSIFSYNALSKYVESAKDEDLKKLFEAVKNKNFELLMQQLANTKNIVTALGGDAKLVKKIDAASSKLKQSLIDAVSSLHPEHVFKIPAATSKKCSEYLNEFLSKDGKIFSTNYDLLLYWVLMRNEIPNAIDGFGRDVIDQGHPVPEDQVELSELRWGNNRETQNIFYVHGALQLFDDGIEIVKEEYDGNFILDNIKTRMDKGQYPIFVTAGNGNEKLNHILHNHYLSDCYDKLCQVKGSLITFGFNFGEYDEHIIRAINEAASQGIEDQLRSIYIGVYSKSDEKHIESIKGKFKCKVNTYDSKTVNIWN